MLNEKGNRINEYIALDSVNELIINASPCGVMVIDNNGVIVAYNENLKRHRSVRDVALMKRKFQDVFYQGKRKDERGGYLDPLLETLETGRGLTKEVYLQIDVSGKGTICRASTAPLRDKRGKHIGACGVYYDLTPYRQKKKQLNEKKQMLIEANAQLLSQHMETIRAFANAIAARDINTRWHSEKVAEYAQQICFNLGVDEHMAKMAYLAGLLHDVGKIGVPESILTKPGPLTDPEYQIIKSHPEIGVQILGSMKNMEEILEVIKYHHERYDGDGYPAGKKGKDIPLLSRVLAVADSFEAMTSDRSYRKSFSMDKAIDEIKRNSGTQFDPQVVDSFMEMVQEQFISK